MNKNSYKGPVVVLGSSGHAKVVISTLQAVGLKVEAAYDDDSLKIGGSILGIPIRGKISDIPDEPTIKAVIAVGDNLSRKRIAANFKRLEWVSAVHPSAFVHSSGRLGQGAVVFAGTVIQPDTLVGAHVIVNTGSTVDHDCIVKDFAHIAPGTHLAGGSRIGEGVFLGIGAAIAPGMEVGDWAVVGAGAVVVTPIPDRVIAVGVPARPKAQR